MVLGFHADNGSEYINYTVAKLLDKLRIEFTKSRPRHSNDNWYEPVNAQQLSARCVLAGFAGRVKLPCNNGEVLIG